MMPNATKTEIVRMIVFSKLLAVFNRFFDYLALLD